MIRHCLTCNKEFKTDPHRLLIGRGKYCSRDCSAAPHRKYVYDNLIRTCPICGKTFTPPRANIRKGNGHYCSPACFHAARKQPLLERFWSHVDKNGPDGCWVWTASLVVAGYGRFEIAGRGAISVHRFSWEIQNGPIPKGLIVCHKCDNPACVNPSHLFLGTHGDNVHDMMNKGRNVILKGEQCSNAKLTEKCVREIRCRHAQGGISNAALAREYGVSVTAIFSVVHHRNWKHVD